MNRIGSLLVLFGGLSVAACFAQPAPPGRVAKRVEFFGASSSFLGVGVAEIDTERAKELQLKEERGVEVKNVADDSPAGKGGVKVGDVVLEYNGQRVEGSEQFVRLVRETPVGRQVKLLISRNGSTQTLTATIGSRSPAEFFPKELDRMFGQLKGLEMPDMPRARMTMQSRALGAETESLGSQLAEYFGVKEGVLVRSVMRGSAAEKAGLKAGDVITKVGDRKVTSPNDIANAVRTSTSTTFPLTIVRSQKELTVSVTIEARSGGVRRSTVRMDVKAL